MDSNQVHALLLLIGRIVTLVLILLVIPKQYKLLKAKNQPEISYLRRRLFLSSVIMGAGQLVPIIIDVLGIFGKGSFGLLLLYVYSNNLTAMLGAYMMWTVYKISESREVEE